MQLGSNWNGAAIDQSDPENGLIFVRNSGIAEAEIQLDAIGGKSSELNSEGALPSAAQTKKRSIVLYYWRRKVIIADARHKTPAETGVSGKPKNAAYS